MSQLRLHQDIAGYQFEGPYMSLRRIPEETGLYAIVCYDGKQYYLLDVAFSDNIKKACQNNEQKECWEKHKQGNILYAFFQNTELNSDTYQLIIEEIRKRYKKIPCGKKSSSE
jgi:hypothetical protein